MTAVVLSPSKPLSPAVDVRFDLDHGRLRVDLSGRLESGDAALLAAAVRTVARERTPHQVRIGIEALSDAEPEALAVLRRLRHQLDTLGYHAVLSRPRRGRARTPAAAPHAPFVPEPGWRTTVLAALSREYAGRADEERIAFAVGRAAQQIDRGLRLLAPPWDQGQHVRAVVGLAGQILDGVDVTRPCDEWIGRAVGSGPVRTTDGSGPDSTTAEDLHASRRRPRTCASPRHLREPAGPH